MTLNQAFNYTPLGEGIFYYLSRLDIPWGNDGYLAQELDLQYHGNFSGGKETSPLVDVLAMDDVLVPQNIESLASVLNRMFASKWRRLWTVQEAEYDPIENYSMTEIETPDILRERTISNATDYSVTTTSDTDSSVYGFNSATAVPQAESSGSSTVTTKGDASKNHSSESSSETGTRRLSRSGNIGVTTSQQMLESEIQLWQWNFFESVFKDLDTVLISPKYQI